MGLLDNKVAIVTGGGQGIGRGIVRAYVREGAKVVIAEISAEHGRQAAEELNQRQSGSAVFVHTDVSKKDQVLRAVDSAVKHYGGLDILVNIAPAAAGTVYEQLVKDIPGFAQAAAAGNPLGRVGDPETDIAPVVVFLASEMARYVNGVTIPIDGGQHLPRYDSRPRELAALEAADGK